MEEKISIHAPLRGRQREWMIIPWRGDISIHAPLRGRHLIEQKKRGGTTYFNPRPLAGAT